MTTGKRKRPPSRINGKHNPEYYKWKYNNDPSWRRKRLERTSLWQKTHQSKRSWDTLQYYYRIKTEIFKLLGNRCSNPECPIPPSKLDLRCLQIDHVHGGGCSAKKRKENPSCFSYYKHILEEIKKGSQDYQLLCVYCNWRKRYLNKELYRKYKAMPH